MRRDEELIDYPGETYFFKHSQQQSFRDRSPQNLATIFHQFVAFFGLARTTKDSAIQRHCSFFVKKQFAQDSERLFLINKAIWTFSSPLFLPPPHATFA